VRAFLRQRLAISISDLADEPDDALPVELDSLEQWDVADRVLDLRLAGFEPEACVDAEVARGSLPPGTLGEVWIEDVLAAVEDIVIAAGDAVDTDEPATSVDVNVDLGSGRSLVGTVANVVADVVRTATVSKVAAKHRLGAWVRLLALTATHPDRPFTAVTIGRGRRGGAGVSRLGPLTADIALEQLRLVADLHARGLREPLPLYCKTSAAYAGTPKARRVLKARDEWETDRWDKEDREREHLLVLGGQVAFDDLLVAVPNTDEDGAGWSADETTRFGRYACRLWEGLLAHEELENL
jgi:exodeoxyribonuclease V gamma subunit